MSYAHVAFYMWYHHILAHLFNLIWKSPIPAVRYGKCKITYWDEHFIRIARGNWIKFFYNVEARRNFAFYEIKKKLITNITSALCTILYWQKVSVRSIFITAWRSIMWKFFEVAWFSRLGWKLWGHNQSILKLNCSSCFLLLLLLWWLLLLLLLVLLLVL